MPCTLPPPTLNKFLELIDKNHKISSMYSWPFLELLWGDTPTLKFNMLNVKCFYVLEASSPESLRRFLLLLVSSLSRSRSLLSFFEVPILETSPRYVYSNWRTSQYSVHGKPRPSIAYNNIIIPYGASTPRALCAMGSSIYTPIEE